MSGFQGVWVRLLGDVIVAGRAALRDMDGRDMPASLQRVAAYSGGKLPPPLASKLLVEIDKSDWLREKVLEKWDGDESEPAGLFLNRPDGWWVDVAEAAGAAADDKGEEELSELRRKMDKLEETRRAAAKKAAEYKKALEKERKIGKQEVESARRSVEAKFAAEASQLDEARDRIAELTDRMKGLAADRSDLQEAFDSLRSRSARTRRLRSGGRVPEGTSRFAPSDPIRLARELDLQAASFSRRPGEEAVPEQPEVSPLVLGSGVRPDSSDAIRWLLDLDEAAVVLVDGYNAQFHIDRSDFTSGAARRYLIDALKRMRAASTIKHRVVVVYDSTLPGARAARSSLAGVEVRFAEKDRIADEEIVFMAEALDRVVVISSDREVREDAEEAGAVVLWSEALEAWLARE